MAISVSQTLISYYVKHKFVDRKLHHVTHVVCISPFPNFWRNVPSVSQKLNPMFYLHWYAHKITVAPLNNLLFNRVNCVLHTCATHVLCAFICVPRVCYIHVHVCMWDAYVTHLLRVCYMCAVSVLHMHMLHSMRGLCDMVVIYKCARYMLCLLYRYNSHYEPSLNPFADVDTGEDFSDYE